MSHSQFHCTGRAYLDMHGLIFETSICYWQDQPGRSASWLAIVGRTDGRPSSEAGRTERASERSAGMMMTTDTRAEEEPRTARGDGGRPWEPTGIPQRSRHAAGGRERARTTTGRGRTSGTRREEGGGWTEPGEATRREPPSRRRAARAPARHTAPTDHAEVPGRRPRAGARGAGVGPRRAPPTHARQRGATPGRTG